MIYESTNKYKFVYVQEPKPKIKLYISVLNFQKKNPGYGTWDLPLCYDRVRQTELYSLEFVLVLLNFVLRKR